MIDFEKNKKKIIKGVLRNLKDNLGERNLAILLSVLAESCDYTMGEKGLAEVRQIEIKFNNLHSTRVDLKQGFKVSH